MKLSLTGLMKDQGCSGLVVAFSLMASDILELLGSCRKEGYASIHVKEKCNLFCKK